MKKIYAACLPVLAYGMFIAELILIIGHPVRCPYEKNISEYEEETVRMPEGEYVCGFDRHEVNEEDPFLTAEVSGWLARQENGRWKPVTAQLLLAGADKSYKVRSYGVKRADVYYTEQSDPDSRDLYIGHLSRFPASVLETGEYRLGFLLEESGEPAVYWTEDTITVP